jgi:hypothetical protein
MRLNSRISTLAYARETETQRSRAKGNLKGEDGPQYLEVDVLLLASD